ncbi:MAG: DNA-processing protein DprA [Clostridium sp.]|nr:DNA-processing protein DprA [Clostridium sp.]MCM1398017.1 DNA-processing protein DprA [Clostridium sp.]MCM1459347.1 DNA-processing protein DprA [Bacteroides sp.]
MFFDEEMIYRLWLNTIEGIGLRTKKRLAGRFGSAGNIYHASLVELSEVIKNDRAERINQNRSLDKAKRLAEEYGKRSILVTYPGNKYYPEKLKHIPDCPEILYIRGDAGILNDRLVGVVGARNPSVYGREIAGFLSGTLAKNNIGIVSGLARGIDAAAHSGAICMGGKTVAVLGCGINVTYPGENAELFAQIERSGTIISEYGLNIPPSAGQFPVRNRLISGLSEGVLVVEAKKKSGSLITADLALEQGKQVYAVPGRINDVLSEGTNNLIKQGALCVTDANDILEELFGVSAVDAEQEKSSIGTKIDKNRETLTDEEARVYSCLGLEPLFIDDIVTISGLGIRKTISILYSLCGRGIIKQPLKGYYIICI